MPCHENKGTENKCYLRIYVRDVQGNAVGNEKYRLEIDGALLSTDADQTDGQGMLYKEIPCSAQTGKLTVLTHAWNLQIEVPPPHSDEVGARVRLANLGFFSAPDEPNAEELSFAYWDFQHANQINRSADLDDPTVDSLDKIHNA